LRCPRIFETHQRLNVEQIVTVLRQAEVGVPLEKQLRID
jgi:hypothetical protein